jgi:hypothetical protein
MTTPFSRAVTPPQPAKDAYGFEELALFRSFTRDSFRAQFGTEAPPYDPTRLIKTWFDSTADTSDPANVAVYKVFARDAKGAWGLRQMVLSAAEAATVNLPGAVEYPPYVIAPTRANRAGVSGIWPVTLSLETEARALLAELGLAELPLYDEGAGSAMPVDYAGDPRRMWNFVYKGVPYSVGGLLASKYRNGVGAPGRWAVGETIEWIPAPPAPTGLDDTRPPREMPVRDLLPNERIAMNMMGPMIVRTDRQQAQAEMAGQFTPADRAILRELQQMVAQLLSRK